MVLVIVIVGMGLAAVMVPLVITQTHTTTFDSGQSRALQAAESGIDVAVGQIRAARSGAAGDPTKLPCGTLSGPAASDFPTTYSVSIAYYQQDPKGLDSTALDALRVDCVAGHGVATMPHYAQLTAVGTDQSTEDSRTLVTTYAFTIAPVSDTDRSIWFSANGQKYCLTSTGKNSAPTIEPCGHPPTDAQKFAYGSDLNIPLADGSLCLRSHGRSGGIVLGPCSGNTFNLDPQVLLNGHLLVDKFGLCISVSSLPEDGSPPPDAEMTDCSGGQDSATQSWVMGSRIGVRRVDGQLINGLQFSRCLTVPMDNNGEGQVSAGALIAYSCAQNADRTAPWEQHFLTTTAIEDKPTTSQWYVCDDGTLDCDSTHRWCMTSPGSDATAHYVTLTTCDSANPDQSWTRYQVVNSSGQPLTDDEHAKYTIQDHDGQCLSLNIVDDLFGADYSKAVVEACNGTEQQKWNVPEDELDTSRDPHSGQPNGAGNPLRDLFEE